MPLTIGPSAWWLKTKESINYYAKLCPVGTILPDESRIICKNGGKSWIVAPISTQVGASWNGSTSGVVGNKPLVSDWSSLNTALTNAGFTPSDWFVPIQTQLQSAYACKSYWDFSSACYWSSTEVDTTNASLVTFTTGLVCTCSKTNPFCVRAMRCVNY